MERLLILLLLLTTSACAETFTLGYPRPDSLFQRELATQHPGRSIVLRLRSGDLARAERLSVESDSVRWTDPSNLRQRSAVRTDVGAIFFTNKGVSPASGALRGMVGSALAGLLVAVLTYNESDPMHLGFAILPPLGGAVGLIGGALYGFNDGRERVFRMASSSPR
ncbi:MAG TPA: hypothetical protein VD948_11725 [Rhodothermales bacterium]|nr:hypothetical protein [Rhodothermales bacterium]